MLPAVRDVAKGLLREIGFDEYYTLEHIANAVEAYTPVTTIVYVEYDVPTSNPILGQFRKYSFGPKAYSAAETIVEVRYAKHLDLPWRRLVVSKELCHALESDKQTHSATGRAMDRLLSRFALESANKPITSTFPAFDAEEMAEIGAMELICPLDVRKTLIGSDSLENLCRDYGLPEEYGTLAFDARFVEIIDGIFENYD